MNIQFYHLTTSPLERALPKLLEKALAAGYKTLVLADSEERVDQLNQWLWTYDPGSFLPHGSAKDGAIAQQPILLSTEMEATYAARIVAVIDGSTPQTSETVERILDIFDGRDTQAVEKARTRWTNYKNAGHAVTYFRQTEQGGWQQAA